jgi:hypothetical protein
MIIDIVQCKRDTIGQQHTLGEQQQRKGSLLKLQYGGTLHLQHITAAICC